MTILYLFLNKITIDVEIDKLSAIQDILIKHCILQEIIHTQL